MRIFTSDLHWKHKNILDFTTRPWSTVEEMGEGLVELWNKSVGITDEIWHLGDFSFVSDNKFDYYYDLIMRLNGRKHFILGNHDSEKLFRKLQDCVELDIEFVGHYKEIKENKKLIILCHYPIQSWRNMGYGSWHLHGHCHGSLPQAGKRLDVGLDNHPEHKFFTMEDVKDFMDSQKIYQTDHHTVRE